MSNHRRSSVLLALALLGCGQRAGGERAPDASSSSTPAGPRAVGSGRVDGGTLPASLDLGVRGASSAVPASVPLEPPSPPPLPTTFVGAKSEKACKAETVELAGYQQHGEVALGAHAEGVAAVWRVRLGGKPQDQVAFASFDTEGRPTARTRGVALTTQTIMPRVFASGTQWTVVWFDEKGLAFTRPHVESVPPLEITHLPAVGAGVAGEVALAASPAGAVLAAAPLGESKGQISLFSFAPVDSVSTVQALGATHHAKAPRGSAVAAGPGGIFVVWDEAGALVGSRFDATGKENEATCAVAPAGDKRERLALAATRTGATVMWMEGTRVRTRALDASGCPSSPIWTVAEGRWASITTLGDTALVTWVAADGRILAARLGQDGSPPARAFDAGEGSSGAKDVPAAIALGTRKVAFAWAEVMSPVISSKRLAMRIVDAACIP